MTGEDGATDEGRAHPHTHHHAHALPTAAGRRPLIIALVLLSAFLVLEVIVAVAAGSLALLSDAGHMITDVGALAAALWAMHLAARPAGGSWTFGWHRAEILSAAGNGVTLVVVAVLVAVEAVHRLIAPPSVEGGPVLVVALIGIAVNLAATWVLARADRTSLNVRGAYAHVLTDLFGFIGTAVAAVVILTSGFARADSIASLLVVVLMLVAARGLLRDSGRVLLEGAPTSIDLDEVRGHLLETDHVLDVHDLHVWTVTSSLPALSAHVVVQDECFVSGHAPQLLDRLQDCLVGHFDVQHSTFQLEPASHGRHETGAHA